MDSNTRVETHWTMLGELYRCSIRASYETWQPLHDGMIMTNRETTAITKWSDGLYSAYFPVANVLVLNRPHEVAASDDLLTVINLRLLQETVNLPVPETEDGFVERMGFIKRAVSTLLEALCK